MRNLVIFGDSWGRGIWSDQHGLLKTPLPYLSECFEKHYDVVANYSTGGESNRHMVDLMQKHLLSCARHGEDIQENSFLFIQTDPFRDLIPTASEQNRPLPSQIYDAVKMVNRITRYNICFTYTQLECLSDKYNIPINITGGCSDIDDLIHEYAPSLNIVCDSFYKLINKDHKNHLHSSTINLTEWNLPIGQEFRKDQIYLENLTELIDASSDKHDIERDYSCLPNEPNYFGYGVDNHPSHMGIDMWIEHMLPRIK